MKMVMFSPSSRPRNVMYAAKGGWQAALLASLMYLSCSLPLASSSPVSTPSTGLSWSAAGDEPQDGWQRSVQQV